MTRRCFQCETENPPEQSFCGSCGAALVLKEYISGQVSKELASAVRDRDTLETESAIKVFEKALGWVKLFGGVTVALLALFLGLVGWKEIDLMKAADVAKQSIEGTTKQSIGEIQTASNQAKQANKESVSNADQLSREMKSTASQTNSELKRQAASVRAEVANSKSELEAVNRLRPEFDSMRAQLGKATSDLDAQQKVISSSEDFVKHVFSSHVISTFWLRDQFQSNYVVFPPPKGVPNSSATVLMLVPETPIDGTLQLQYSIFMEPPSSYWHIHNMILFSCPCDAMDLKNYSFDVSFFPDKSDKETIKAFTVRDGRVYADDQPMPKFGQQADPDWKGNKWMQVGQPSPPLQPVKP